MNRDVMSRQMFRYGGGVPMQEGGVPPAPMPMPMPMPEIDPEQVEINQAAEGAMQQGIDPAVLEGMLGQYSQQMTDLDNAEDYETVINGIRGDNLPMDARYQELAGLVGPEDAQQTPESVLTLLQPVMLMTGVDQGIGALAQDEMMAPIEGPMAEGIMSTVNMEPPASPPPEEMMVAMGGTNPVNFNQGGPVQYMVHGGVPHDLKTTFDERKDVYQSLLGPQAEEYEDQKKMTQAQMLFDVAQGALAFATPGERRMSPAERLAQSFSPVLGNIGARAGELNKFKQDQAKEGRALDVAALGSAETVLAAERAGSAALAAKIQTVVNKNDPNDIQRFDLNIPEQRTAFNALDDRIYVATTMPSMVDVADGTIDLGNSYAAKVLKLISSADTLEAYADGTLDETTANLINNYLTNEMRALPAWDPATQSTVMKPGLVVSPSVMNAINARGTIEGASLPTIGVKGALDEDVDGKIKRIPFGADGNPDFSAFEDEPLFIITGIDLTKSQGMASTANRFFNMMAGQVKDVGGPGSGYAGNSGKITSQADTQLDTLARNIMGTARKGVDGRVFALDVEMLQKEVNGFQPGGGKTDNAARDQLVTVRNNLAMMYSQAEARLKFSRTEKESTEIRGLQESVGQLIAETTGAIAVYDKFLTTDPIAEAMSDRSSSSGTGGSITGGSITGGLPRASSVDGEPE